MRKKLLGLLLAFMLSTITTPLSVSAVEVTIPTPFGDKLYVEDEYEHYFMTCKDETTVLLLYNGTLQFSNLTDTEVNVTSLNKMKVIESSNEFGRRDVNAGTVITMPAGSVDDYATDIDISYIENDKSLDFTAKTPEGLQGIVGSESIIAMTILPTAVNITVPLNIAASIDVNESDGFVHGDIQIRNNTQAPVKITLAKLRSDNLPFEKLIVPEELPKYLSWETLGVEDSNKYFSLGIRPTNSVGAAWKSKLDDFTYTYPGLFPTHLGVIEAASSSNLELDSFYGKASMTEKEFNFSVTFVAELE